MSNADILRGGYEAFARQDIPAVLALFDDAIEWYAPDELPDGGFYRGKAGVSEFFAKLPAHYAELRVEPDRFHESGDRVVVEGHHRGTLTGGAEFEVGFAHVWTLRDGKVLAYREYADTGKLLSLLTPPVATASTTGV